MTIEQLRELMVEHGYTGLVFDDECGCTIEDLMPCGCTEIIEDCKDLEDLLCNGCTVGIKKYVYELTPKQKESAYERGFVDSDWLVFEKVEE